MYMYACMYIYILYLIIRIHAHTHIRIYIYIYVCVCRDGFAPEPDGHKGHLSNALTCESYFYIMLVFDVNDCMASTRKKPNNKNTNIYSTKAFPTDIMPTVFDENALKNKHLLFALKDSNGTLLAQAVAALTYVFGPAPIPFGRDMLLNGELVGLLTGSFRITYENHQNRYVCEEL